MRIAAAAIFVFGAAGVAALLLPQTPGAPSTLSYWLDRDTFQVVQILFMFGAPVVVAALALVRPPLARWHAGIALVAFAVAAIKTRIWTLLPALADSSLAFGGMAVAVVGGGIASAIALARARPAS